MERKLVWNKRPSSFLKQTLKKISKQSPANAEKVEGAILDNLDKALINPERFQMISSRKATVVSSELSKHIVIGLLISSLIKKSGC